MKIFARLLVASIALTCSFYFVGCKKQAASDNAYGLPDATKTGANIFASELIGVGTGDIIPHTTYTNFTADNDLNDPLYSSSGNGAWLNNDTLIISGAPQIGSYFNGIKFTIIGNLQQGNIYTIDSVTTSATFSTDSLCTGASINATISVSDSGTIQLTKFDTVNKIVSGIFTCDFPFAECDSTVYATQGRFDYKYH